MRSPAAPLAVSAPPNFFKRGATTGLRASGIANDMSAWQAFSGDESAAMYHGVKIVLVATVRAYGFVENEALFAVLINCDARSTPI
jgi:hypothetical protein